MATLEQTSNSVPYPSKYCPLVVEIRISHKLFIQFIYFLTILINSYIFQDKDKEQFSSMYLLLIECNLHQHNCHFVQRG